MSHPKVTADAALSIPEDSGIRTRVKSERPLLRRAESVHCGGDMCQRVPAPARHPRRG